VIETDNSMISRRQDARQNDEITQVMMEHYRLFLAVFSRRALGETHSLAETQAKIGGVVSRR
jgi:hypothetical protein